MEGVVETMSASSSIFQKQTVEIVKQNVKRKDELNELQTIERNRNLWLCSLVKVSRETPKLYSHWQRANDDCSIDSNTPTADGRQAAEDGEWWKGTANSGEKAVDREWRLQRPLVQEGLELYTTHTDTLTKTSNVERKIVVQWSIVATKTNQIVCL